MAFFLRVRHWNQMQVRGALILERGMEKEQGEKAEEDTSENIVIASGLFLCSKNFDILFGARAILGVFSREIFYILFSAGI